MRRHARYPGLRRPSGGQGLVRRLVAGWLVLALAVYGYTGVMVEMLGSMHRHVQAAPAASLWADSGPVLENGMLILDTVRHWHASAQTQRLALLDRAHEEAHHHGLFARHHHEAADATVAALDASAPGGHGGDDSSTTVTGSALLPMCTICAPDIPALPAGQAPWPLAAAWAWLNADIPLLDRPPQA